MTEQEIRIACAEKAGWKWQPKSGDKLTNPSAYWYPPNGVTIPPFREPQNMAYLRQLPRYTESLDAIMPLVRKLDEDEMEPEIFYRELRTVRGESNDVTLLAYASTAYEGALTLISSTPLQIATAYLKTTGGWVE